MHDSTKTAEFRTANEADANSLTALIQRYYEFDHIPFDPQQIASNVRVLVNDSSLGRAWLVYSGEHAVGYMIVVFWFDLEFGGRCALLTDFYLEAAQRRKGRGRKMLQHVEDFCGESGIGALELQVLKSNNAALRFYEACGFCAYDRVPMAKHLLAS